MIGQIISNAIKYRQEHFVLSFSARIEKIGFVLLFKIMESGFLMRICPEFLKKALQVKMVVVFLNRRVLVCIFVSSFVTR